MSAASMLDAHLRDERNDAVVRAAVAFIAADDEMQAAGETDSFAFALSAARFDAAAKAWPVAKKALRKAVKAAEEAR